MKKIFFLSLLLPMSSMLAQNIVPNPSFEDTLNCFPGLPNLNCLLDWKDHSDPVNPALNTADLCFNTAVFFPPSSIPAFDGTKYIGIDCQPMNSEYVQVQLTQAMVAGTSYCVSFYVSVCDQTIIIAPSLGAYFSVNELTTSPFVTGLNAHVQGVVPFDPTQWTKITGTYVATGGEQFMTLGGFQNTGPAGFRYMYIDMVEVYPLSPLSLGADQGLCPGETLLLNANAGASAYLWNTGATSASITVSSPGIYWVEQQSGSCVQTDTILFFNTCDTITPASANTDGVLFIPNSFSPNGDGINDFFFAVGENVNDFELLIFNRWGEKIFEAQNFFEAWDGKFQNQKAEEGIYVYKLSYRIAYKLTNTTGHICLIR